MKPPAMPPSKPSLFCKCYFELFQFGGKGFESKLHEEQQDIECDAWKRLLELVEVAAKDGRKEFAPQREMGRGEWCQIITLPATISKLKSVKRLMLYTNNLVRLPPEIGEMTNLEEFDIRHSYRLHWFPYEITRCKKLKDSCLSIRALYGNDKNHQPFPFPKLPVGATVEAGSPTNCSVCNAPISASNLHQVWISLKVATDGLPLLVNACSKACIDKLPRPPECFVQKPHLGGLNIQQPPRW